MEELLGTIFNVAFYIFIFKMIIGGTSKKKPPKNVEGSKEKTYEKKKKKSFFDEALEQLAKFEQDPQEEIKQKTKLKRIPKVPVTSPKAQTVKYKSEESVEPIRESKKNIDENNEKIYYNNEESLFELKRKDLKKAIVFSEIIGEPVSRKNGLPYRR